MNRRAPLLAAAVALFVGAPCSGEGVDVDFFEARIRPVLVERCYKCHSATAEKLRGGLRLDTRAGMLKGGNSGKPTIVAGRPEESVLIEAIRHGNDELQMPPAEEGGKLSDAHIKDFVTWIREGAVDPRTNEVATASSPRADHWAFKPVTDPPLPSVKDHAWPQTPIDSFILAKLEGKDLAPSSPADKRTLIRRASFDLTGLPPTWDEAQKFYSDESPHAYERLVERLLASRHYGERWGRHWLDVARYSDTKGYVYDREEKRFVHSHVYRDWVVGAFNDDMPYDRFLKLQIAGDQMVSSNEWDLAALGFLTVGRRFLGVMHDIIDDRIDVLMRGTQGLTASCARCHDHKFDPIPTRDYYSLYGVFNSTSEKTVPVASGRQTDKYEEYAKGLAERESKLRKSFQEKRAKKTDRLRAQVAEYLPAVLDVKQLPSEEFYVIMGADDLNPIIVRQWDTFIHRCSTNHRVFGPWRQLAALRDFESDAPNLIRELSFQGERVNALVAEALTSSPPASMREVADRYGKLFSEADKAWRDALKKSSNQLPAALVGAQEEIRQILYGADSPAAVPDGAVIDIEWFFEEDGRVELAKLHAEIDRWLLKAPGAPPHAVILADRPEPKNTRVFLRGNPANKGEEVPRQYLELLSGPNRRPFQRGSGRLELAEAIANPDNPLTARVMVNRVWQYHFGAGLVSTASDFGTRCEPPSHPELLDWLARRFIDDGWSLKKLHKRIMLSAAYQQRSDAVDARSAQVDPENRLLWRMNRHRLDFESTRDSLLAVSGELDMRSGGKAAEMFAGNDNKRRTLYGYIDRQFVPSVLRVFDFANPDLHIPERPETTVPQQALYFMNNAFVTERARALAERLKDSPPKERVEQLYHVAYQRSPTARQIDLALEFFKESAPAEPIVRSKPSPSPWLYGYGVFDESSQRVKDFAPLPHFTGEAWQGGAQWPDTKLGWLQLTAEGGHPGNDLQHAVVRRWIAPSNMVVTISGTIGHEPKEGDGIVARVVSSRTGMLGTWKLHASKTEVKISSVEVQTADTIDFLVDIGGELHSDQFKWIPIIKAVDAGPELGWNARKDFNGPPVAPPQPLNPWEKYVQVVLQSNEFMFVD